MINIVLYEPEIPENTGNIMRTCAGTNSHLHLIEPLGFALNEKRIKRSGVNYVDNCHYTRYEDFQDFKSKNPGIYYYFTRYATKNYANINYQASDNIYLIFGKESTGIPKDILENNFDNCVRIPTNDKIRALNVANSVAIALYEVLRQKDFPELIEYDPFKGSDFLIKKGWNVWHFVLLLIKG